jgi:hypothetical protein
MNNTHPLQVTDVTLAETLDRVLDTGAVLRGDIVISVADVDLLYLDVRLLLSAVETALRHGALHRPPTYASPIQAQQPDPDA